ncbi:MAG TPA: flagellar biosynthesis protein FlhA [Polyangiales bacterium]|nr:flagellar biosynthesis protein FlhA [Polyangiales bacterium]
MKAPRADLALALLVLAVIAMMVVPLPTWLIDLAIALNLGFSVLLLAAALYVREPLGLAAFPALLLLSTLYRLALNVASTRLILLQADAGQVIDAFGHFVVRGDYRVGALVFVMLTLIQFIVIARGAERVAEVSARFSLDAMPGKQLAIDSELRAGALRPEGARQQRKQLERESQLYGALDGALKFVKGDAIAGLAITAINFVGGVSIGVFGRDLAVQQSLQTYGLLTIGDGLVTQLPALLGATAAGLIVTRVAPEGERSLASQIASALLDEPRALAVGALVLLVLALVPGLPAWPFLAVFLVVAAVLIAKLRARPAARGEWTIELGDALHAKRSTLGVRETCAKLERELGIELPVPELVRADVPSFQLRLRELPELPLTGETVAQALERFVRANAEQWLDLDAVERALTRLEREQPALVRASVPKPLSPALLTEVLRRLVREGVSVRWLGEILDGLARHNEQAQDGDDIAGGLAEHARRTLARRISHALAPGGTLHVLRLTPELEETLSDGLRAHALVLPPELAREIASAIEHAHKAAPLPHALVTQTELRRHVRALIAERAPALAVVTAHELLPHLSLSTSAPIGP